MQSIVWRGNTVGVNKWKRPKINVRVPWAQTPRPRTSSRSLLKNYYPTMFLETSYIEFKNSLIKLMRGMKPIEGYVDLTVTKFLKASKDSDAALKGIMDALTESGAIKDDRFIRNIIVLRHYHSAKTKDPVLDTVVIEISPVPKEEIELIEREIKDDFSHLEG